MAENKIHIEVEISFYEIIKNNKKWWQFWKRNKKRVLIAYDDLKQFGEK